MIITSNDEKFIIKIERYKWPHDQYDITLKTTLPSLFNKPVTETDYEYVNEEALKTRSGTYFLNETTLYSFFIDKDGDYLHTKKSCGTITEIILTNITIDGEDYIEEYDKFLEELSRGEYEITVKDNELCPLIHVQNIIDDKDEYSFDDDDISIIRDYIINVCKIFNDKEYIDLYSNKVLKAAIDSCLLDYISNGKEFISDLSDNYIINTYFSLYFEEYKPDSTTYEKRVGRDILYAQRDRDYVLIEILEEQIDEN